MANSYIVLGNGFSMDLVKKMNKENQIDLRNLFTKGEYVLYPKAMKKGFLSRKHTPNLWILGARSYIEDEKALQLVTDVITCANVFNLSMETKMGEQKENTSVYINAYSELSSYLRYLFVYYNSLVNEDDLKNILDSIEIINYIKDNMKTNKIYIITYNYDIFLERLLELSKIDYDIFGFTNNGANVVIFKPHGSISFSFKIKVPESSPYNIRNVLVDAVTQNANNFEIIYDLKDDFPIVNAIIPPAGDSTRFSFAWIKEIRKGIDDIIKKSTSKDEMILFGLSYWHVDRNEIDEILLSMDASMEVKYVDPNLPTSLDAVLSSLFKNYIHYSSGNLLKE